MEEPSMPEEDGCKAAHDVLFPAVILFLET